MRLFAALAATWPPAEVRRLGGWTLRRDADAGNRVSAATLDGPDGDIPAAEAATLIVVAPPAALAPEAADERAILCDAPLARMREIWTAGGIGRSRQAVMARAPGPKAYLFGRSGDAPAACAFVACDREVAMLHALEVAPGFRRQGLGTALTRAAAAYHYRLHPETDL